MISGGNTEMAGALRCKVPADTITGTTRQGGSPYWHQPSDTFDKMDPAIMEKSWHFTRSVIARLDDE